MSLPTMSHFQQQMSYLEKPEESSEDEELNSGSEDDEDPDDPASVD